MASGILATGNQASLASNTTKWWAWGAQMVAGAGTEAAVQSKIRGTATLQNMQVSVASNSIAAASTITSRKNTAAGNLSVSITASTTGVFSDTTHTDSLVAGDLVCVSSVTGNSAGSAIVSGITAELNGASITIFCGAGDTASTFQTSANYTSLSGGGVQTGTEANRQNKMPVAGTLSNLQMNVATGPAATLTVRLRKNGANGNQVLSITAGTTGIVEDTTNSDSVALNDLVTVSVVMASGASGNANLISTKFVPTTASATPLFVGAAGAFLTNPAYIPAIGQSASTTTEANVKVPAPIAGTLSLMTMFVQVNSAGVSTTFTSRKNGAAGNQTISVTAAATGQFQDTTHSDTLAAGDVFNYQCSGTGASSLAVTNAGGMFTASGGAVAYTLTAAAGSFIISGQAAILRLARKVVAALGTFAMTGKTAGLLYGRRAVAVVGAFAISGQAVAFRVDHKLPAAVGAYTISGQSAAFHYGRTLTAAAGSFALGGQTAGLRADRPVAAAAGSFALTGQAAALRAGRALTASAGSYTLSGLPAALRAARSISAGAGAFTLAGQSAALTKTSASAAYTLTAGAGTLTVSGQAAVLRRAARLTAGAGAFVLTGQSATLPHGFRVSAGAGAFAVSGQSARLGIAHRVRAGVGAFSLTGRSAELVFSGAVAAPVVVGNIRNVSTDDPDFGRWRRSAAFAINSLISRVQAPQVNSVRYNPATPGLEYWDGTAWQPA